ncbi:MAG TPA: RDD family protein [Cytophagaceae bacterium]|jgi:uncharacterized RDD family membrane protein YckC|nr:RDD family protein [Cytophagaceae bacterium]
MNLADKSTRLYNYVVDIFCISIIIFFAFFFIVLGFNPEGNSIYYIVCFLGYFGYYFLMEWRTGRTLGKFLTNTKVKNIHGEPPTFLQILIRTSLRFPLLDGISFLFGSEVGIHDMLSGTRVVKIK